MNKKNDLVVLDELMYLTDLETNSNLSIFKTKMVKYSKPIIKKVEKALYKSPSFINLVKSTIPQEQYVAVFSNKNLNKIKTGAIKVMSKKNGYFSGSLVDQSTGKVIQNIDLEKISFRPELTRALIDYSMQRQIANLSDDIRLNYKEIIDVEQGLENDRIARAIALENDFIRIYKIDNPRKKKIELENFVRKLEDVRQPLMLSQKSNLNELKKQPLDLFKTLMLKSEDDNRINIRIKEIKKSYGCLNKVALMGYMSYHDLGEYEQANKFLGDHYIFIDENYREKDISCLMTFDNKFKWDQLIIKSKKTIKYIVNHENILMLKNEDLKSGLINYKDDINLDTKLIASNSKFAERRKYMRYLRTAAKKAAPALITFVIFKKTKV